MQVYTFVDAVKKLPTNFSEDEIEPIMKRLNPELVGQIRSLFIVLSDDQFRKRLRKNRSGNADQAQNRPAQEAADGEANGEANGEAEASGEEEEVEADVPPIEVVSSKPGSSRSNNRGASSVLAAPAKTKK